MRNDQHRHRFGIDTAKDLGFDRRVDGAGRIIEQQQRRATIDRSGERHPLTLPTRQRDPSFANDRLVTLRGLLDKTMSSTRRRGGDQGRPILVAERCTVVPRAVAHRDVLADRLCE